MAVAVEDLDAGGEIDDVEAVTGVDRDGPRLDEVAVADAALTPDQLWLGARPATARQDEQAKHHETASVPSRNEVHPVPFRRLRRIPREGPGRSRGIAVQAT